MGWHYILTFSCKVLPEYIEFIEKEYLKRFFDEDKDIHYKSDPLTRYNSFAESYEDDDEDEDHEEKERLAQIEKEIQEEKEIIEKEYELLPKKFKDIIDIWRELCIGNHFYEYDVNGLNFTCKISKKVIWHEGNLEEDYKTFLNDIIVPITSEISFCEIKSDDYGCITWSYSDSELRNIPFRLQDKVKTVEHIYSDDGSEIIESRVIYKYSIKELQLLDLNRVYGIK